MLKVTNVSKTYGSREILAPSSFTLEAGQKVALVGANGAGKTTLLKMLAGLEVPDSGTVEIQRDALVGYLPQDTLGFGQGTIEGYLRAVTGIAALEEELALLSGQLEDETKHGRYGTVETSYQRLHGYVFRQRAEAMLAGFGLEGVPMERPLQNLSSGQRSKVALAGILLKGVDLLLLDEPTNNLDLPALLWLEEFLVKSEAAILIVSHDRRFLDRIANRVMELDWHSHELKTSGGNFSDYLLRKEKERVRQMQTYEQQRDEIIRLQQEAKERRAASARGSNYQGSDNDKFLRGFKQDRAGRSGKAANAIEKRIDHMEMVERPPEREPLMIELETGAGAGNRDIELEGVVAGYGNDFQLGPVSLRIGYGDRLAVLGLNGSGKSTLLKAVTGELAPTEGKVTVGSGIMFGKLLQEHENLPRDESLLQFLSDRVEAEEHDIFARLVQAGFAREQVRDPIATISPGGRARLTLVYFSFIAVNTLVLDEPTNHLDLEAMEALEEVLQTYAGTVIIVSHDRYFLERIKLSDVYQLVDGTLQRIPDLKAFIKDGERRARKLIKQL